MKFFLHHPATFSFIPTAFPKTFPAKKNSATVVNARQKKKRGKKSERRGEERKRKEIVKTALSLLNPSELCFLRMPKLIRRLPSAGNVKGFEACFISLQPDSDQKTARLALRRVFQQNSHGE